MKHVFFDINQDFFCGVVWNLNFCDKLNMEGCLCCKLLSAMTVLTNCPI
jgi:hypothetical protein